MLGANYGPNILFALQAFYVKLLYMETTMTPMLKQYHAMKSNHSDCVRFFRLGDFYEMFFEDARIVSRALDIVLTSRGKTQNTKIPMCGFPHHAAENYIAKLIKLGQKLPSANRWKTPRQPTGHC